jgi:glyoxylase-like metal-dependent hydrolase (beta-lactamase superfamily II)
MEVLKVKLGVTNCYIIGDEKKVLIDAGMPGEFDKFTHGLEDLNISPEEISLIVITHGHWDHIGCTKKIKDLTGAKVLAHKQDKALIEEGRKFMPPAPWMPCCF